MWSVWFVAETAHSVAEPRYRSGRVKCCHEELGMVVTAFEWAVEALLQNLQKTGA